MYGSGFVAYPPMATDDETSSVEEVPKVERMRDNIQLYMFGTFLFCFVGICYFPFADPTNTNATPKAAYAFAALIALGVGRLFWGLIKGAYSKRELAGLIGATALLINVGFTACYFYLGTGNFNEPLSNADAFYFQTSVFTTTGFGDLHAERSLARVLVGIQSLTDVVFFGLVIGAAVPFLVRHPKD